MSIFAGVYHLDRDSIVAPEWRVRLRQHASRDARNEVSEFAWPAAHVVHVDIGAYAYPSFSANDGRLTAVAGQIISDHRPLDDRRHEIAPLGAELVAGQRCALRSARGTFAAVVYESSTHGLWLAVDRLGVRPIYCWSDGRTIVFSTAKRILEGMSDLIGLELDTVGTIETATFGFALGDRTAYRNVRRLRSAEIVYAGDGRVHNERWFRWDEIPHRTTSNEGDLQELYARFREAVALRAGSDRIARAALSGGMDSRCVVAVLAESMEKVHTYNISWHGSYDQALARDYAARAGTRHHEAPLPQSEGGSAWPRLIAKTLNEDSLALVETPKRNQVVWSGDGGSFCVGRIYITTAMLEMMRSGQTERAVRAFLKRNCSSVPFLLAEQRERVRDVPVRSFMTELAALRDKDPGQNLFVFVMENGQRQILSGFYEDIDINRIEYQLPFFDAEFLQTSASFPLDCAMEHVLYNRWIKLFPRGASEVAWQAYPGHEPCPIPLPAGYSNQWEYKNRQPLSRVMRDFQKRLQLVLDSKFPANLMSRSRGVGACVASLVAGPRFEYAFAALQVFVRHTKHCPGPSD